MPSPTAEHYRTSIASTGQAVGPSSILCVSEASLSEGAVGSYDLTKRIEPVKKCRGLSKGE
jgi:urease subunit alpha